MLTTSEGERVRSLRILLGMSQKDLSAATGFSQAHVSQVENGIRVASEEFLDAVARCTASPRSYLEAQPIDLPPGSLRFRKLASSNQTDTRRVDVLMTEAYRVISSALNHARVTPPDLPTLASEARELSDDEIGEWAQQTRLALGVGLDGPVMNVTRACERAGIAVIPLTLPGSSEGDEHETVGHFGVSYWPSKDEHAIIGFFSTPSGDRQRFTIGHELGHLVLHSRRRYVSDPEGEANRFAASFLLPKHRVVEAMDGAYLTLQDFARMKATWGMSIQAIIMRASRAGYIDENRRTSLFKQISARGWRKAEPVTVHPETPVLVRRAFEAQFGKDLNLRRLEARVGLHALILRSLAPAVETRS